MTPWFARFWMVGAWVILLTGSLYYHHPSERILGQSDAASYALSAVAVARGEGFGPNKPVLNEMPAAVRKLVVEEKHPLGLRDAAPQLRARPFYLEWQLGESEPGNLVPRFPPGYAAVSSVGYRLAGWRGLLAVNAVLMVFSGLLVSYLAGRAGGPWSGVAAAVLWAVFPLNVWIANSTLAEPLVLLVGLGAISAWVRSLDSPSSGWLFVFGACVGVGPVVKLDALPWLLLPVIYAWEHRRSGIARALLPGLVALPILLVCLIVLLLADSGYLLDNVFALVRQPAVGVAVVGVLAVVGVCARALWRRGALTGPGPAEASSSTDSAYHRWTKWILFASWIAGLVYLYFVRPRSVGADQIYWAPFGRVVPSLREVTLVRLGWYLPPLSLWAAMLSVGATVLWARETWLRALALIGGAMLLFVSYDHINFPVEPFTCRRYLPQAVPALVVCLVCVRSIAQPWRPRVLGAVFVAAVAIVHAGWHACWVNARMNARADAEGVLDHLQTIADTVGPNALIVMRRSGPLLELAPVLAFGFDRDVLPIQRHGAAGERELEAYLRAQESAGRRLWFWTATTTDSLGLRVHTLQPATRHDFTVPFLHMSTTDQPFTWEKRIWKGALRPVSFRDSASSE